VYVTAPTFVNAGSSSQSVLYKEKVLTFDLTLISSIRVESAYSGGIALNKDHRTATIKVYSNVDFQITSETE